MNLIFFLFTTTIFSSFTIRENAYNFNKEIELNNCLNDEDHRYRKSKRLISSHFCTNFSDDSLYSFLKIVCVYKNVCLKPNDKGYFYVSSDGNIESEDRIGQSHIIYYTNSETDEIPFDMYITPPFSTEIFQLDKNKMKITDKKTIVSTIGFIRDNGSIPDGSLYIDDRRVGLLIHYEKHNLGHFLTEYVSNFLDSQVKLGMELTYNSQLISLAPNTNPFHYSVEPKFTSGYSLHKMSYVNEIIENKNNEFHYLNSPIRSSNHLICFKELIIGNNLWLNTQTSKQIKLLRSWFYNNYKLDYLIKPKKHFIVMANKAIIGNNGRGFINGDEINFEMKKEFGDIFLFTNFYNLKGSEQVELMLKTTIFITSPGGASLIGLFLNHKALLLILDVIDNNRSTMAFGGSEHSLWNRLTEFINVQRYYINNNEMVIPENKSGSYGGNYNINVSRLIAYTKVMMRN